MSETKVRLPLAKAQQLALAIIEDLKPSCVRLALAGSVRRLEPECGDIELVAIPEQCNDLLGWPIASKLDLRLETLIAAGRLVKLKGADRYKQFRLVKSGAMLDLFIVTPETWGVQLLIRTGPAAFAHRFVTPRAQGGRILPAGWRVSSGRLQNETGKCLSTPEERDVFEAVEMDYVEPWRRA
jgi:DNA polymerase/3'-5' exonuclease PolX